MTTHNSAIHDVLLSLVCVWLHVASPNSWSYTKAACLLYYCPCIRDSFRSRPMINLYLEWPKQVCHICRFQISPILTILNQYIKLNCVERKREIYQRVCLQVKSAKHTETSSITQEVAARTAGRDETRTAGRDAARTAGRDAARTVGRDAARTMERDVMRTVGRTVGDIPS